MTFGTDTAHGQSRLVRGSPCVDCTLAGNATRTSSDHGGFSCKHVRYLSLPTCSVFPVGRDRDLGDHPWPEGMP